MYTLKVKSGKHTETNGTVRRQGDVFVTSQALHVTFANKFELMPAGTPTESKPAPSVPEAATVVDVPKADVNKDEKPKTDSGPTTYSIVPREGAKDKFDVVDASNVAVNKRALTKEKAEELLKSMTAETD